MGESKYDINVKCIVTYLLDDSIYDMEVEAPHIAAAYAVFQQQMERMGIIIEDFVKRGVEVLKIQLADYDKKYNSKLDAMNLFFRTEMETMDLLADELINLTGAVKSDDEEKIVESLRLMSTSLIDLRNDLSKVSDEILVTKRVSYD